MVKLQKSGGISLTYLFHWKGFEIEKSYYSETAAYGHMEEHLELQRTFTNLMRYETVTAELFIRKTKPSGMILKKQLLTLKKSLK
jgi:hypothetical protein